MLFPYIILSLYHSFPFLVYTLYMNEWKNEWKNYHLSIWRLVSEKLSSFKVVERTPNYIQTMWTCKMGSSSIRRVKSSDDYKKLWCHNSSAICHIWFGLQSRNAFSCTPSSMPTLVGIKGNFVWTFFTQKLNPVGG